MKLQIFAGLLVVTALSLGALTYGESEATSGKTIKIVEKLGYFETHGNIYNRASGPVVFAVDNRSGKDAGFVLTREGEEPRAIGIKDGESGRLEVSLEPGEYQYFCPIIPTPKYTIIVK